MRNFLTQLKDLLGHTPLQVGTVTDVTDGAVKVQLPGGAVVSARGSADVGAQVYVRGGVVEGEAPDLPVHTIDI